MFFTFSYVSGSEIPEKILIFQETKTLEKLLIYREKENPKKFFIFQKTELLT